MKRILLAIIAVALLAAVAAYFLLSRSAGIPVYGTRIVATLPHDPQAFTEGLFFQNGALYESTGEIGSSSVRKVRPETGAIEQSVDLASPYFGEGIIGWKDRIYQLTWQNKTGFTYGLSDFALRDTFAYEGEGWGLTQNGKNIIMSDGTSTLRFLDPETMKPVSMLKVTANGCPVDKLNELEWVDGMILANIWQTNLIARIDPASGKVASFLDVGALGPKNRDIDDVPNGIAYDGTAKRLFVTGKRWPQLYQVEQGDKVDSEAAKTLERCAN
ncbi:glutaminyl-peptide cyclotransferase [Sphingomonas sp. MMS12-HWE2-04]|uniref:glutaminyl-peptide cyclotransferase n=1 Tax=Sphingomonas sp. MMS12-HWE2-04 TaxID=3234199 RepID=UPI00384A8462